MSKTTKSAVPDVPSEAITISAPNFRVATVRIRGITPLVVHAFSKKARSGMVEGQLTSGAKKKKKEVREPDQEVIEACHIGQQGGYGFPCSAIRAACIRACSMAGFQMTRAKMSIFCLADDIDRDDGMPLFNLDDGEPEKHEGVVRLANGTAYVAYRPMWREWGATLRLQYDGDQFSLTDVNNLVARAGVQVGIGEGRPYSKSSHGTGWGTFGLVGADGEVIDFNQDIAA